MCGLEYWSDELNSYVSLLNFHVSEGAVTEVLLPPEQQLPSRRWRMCVNDVEWVDEEEGELLISKWVNTVIRFSIIFLFVFFLCVFLCFFYLFVFFLFVFLLCSTLNVVLYSIIVDCLHITTPHLQSQCVGWLRLSGSPLFDPFSSLTCCKHTDWLLLQFQLHPSIHCECSLSGHTGNTAPQHQYKVHIRLVPLRTVPTLAVSVLLQVQ